jgi:hypothetical protein
MAVHLGGLAHGGVGRPAPESMTLRVALTSSIRRATTTLNLNASTSRGVRQQRMRLRRSAGVARLPLDVGVRRDLARDAPGAGQELRRPTGETSAQSMSSSGGPGERHRHAQRVGAVRAQLARELDQVAP